MKNSFLLESINRSLSNKNLDNDKVVDSIEIYAKPLKESIFSDGENSISGDERIYDTSLDNLVKQLDTVYFFDVDILSDILNQSKNKDVLDALNVFNIYKDAFDKLLRSNVIPLVTSLLLEYRQSLNYGKQYGVNGKVMFEQVIILNRMNYILNLNKSLKHIVVPYNTFILDASYGTINAVPFDAFDFHDLRNKSEEELMENYVLNNFIETRNQIVSEYEAEIDKLRDEYISLKSENRVEEYDPFSVYRQELQNDTSKVILRLQEDE